MVVGELNHQETLLQEVTTQSGIPITSLWIMGILLGFLGKIITAKRNCEFSELLQLHEPIKMQRICTDQGRMHERTRDRFSTNL